MPRHPCVSCMLVVLYAHINHGNLFIFHHFSNFFRTDFQEAETLNQENVLSSTTGKIAGKKEIHSKLKDELGKILMRTNSNT